MELLVAMQLRHTFHAATVMLVFAAWTMARAQTGTAPDKQPVVHSDKPRIAACRVGFASRYKVGFWTPVWIDVVNASGLQDLRIEISVVDSDGVETVVSAAVGGTPSEETVTNLLYAKAGRTNAPLHVSLVADGAEIDRVELDPAVSAPGMPVLDALPATSELIVSLGGGSSGLTEAVTDRDATEHEIARRVVEIDTVASLPDKWFGYEAVDALVISASDLGLCRALANDASRLAALRRWVELGGRIVIVCGGNQAEELFADGQPLAAFLPGKLEDTVRLTEATALEHFAEASEPIAGRRGALVGLAVPKLSAVRGSIEVYVGRQPTDLPIVVRAPLGLGEVTFASVDLAAPPLAKWTGRGALWQALLRPYVEAEQSEDGPRTLGTLGYNDLSGALRQRLGRSFPSVTTVTFPVVALFVIVYLVLLGPAHYWLVHHFGGRPALAWVVFPLLVLGTSGVAYFVGQRSKGDAPRVNQVELVDFDMTTRQARGTFLAALYSPDSRQYDLGLHVDGDHAELVTAETLLSWWGLTGVGVGGMHAGTLNLAAIDTSYQFSSTLDAMLGVPILTSSTKSVIARWNAATEEIVRAELTDDDGLVVGNIVNETGGVLRDVRLLYGTWAYRLGDLRSGQRLEIGEHLSPITVNTLITRSVTRGETADRNSDRASFFVDRASTGELLMVMMFYRAAGGETFARLPSRYHSYIDLSRLLELGRAILVADVTGGGSRLVDPPSGEPLGRGGESQLVYRFVLAVEK